MFRYVGLIFCGKQGIEKAVKFATAYEADVADLHRASGFGWTWLPQSMSIRRVFDRKLFSKDIIIGHQWPEGGGEGL